MSLEVNLVILPRFNEIFAMPFASRAPSACIAISNALRRRAGRVRMCRRARFTNETWKPTKLRSMHTVVLFLFAKSISLAPFGLRRLLIRRSVPIPTKFFERVSFVCCYFCCILLIIITFIFIATSIAIVMFMLLLFVVVFFFEML